MSLSIMAQVTYRGDLPPDGWRPAVRGTLDWVAACRPTYASDLQWADCCTIAIRVEVFLGDQSPRNTSEADVLEDVVASVAALGGQEIEGGACCLDDCRWVRVESIEESGPTASLISEKVKS